jgi:TRAP-type mannitol/chloroaromatic compound transport system permease small subunit
LPFVHFAIGIFIRPQLLGWQSGEYSKQPYGLFASWPFARMILDGVPHMKNIVSDVNSAATFIDIGLNEAKTKDANDLIYILEASTSKRQISNVA